MNALSPFQSSTKTRALTDKQQAFVDAFVRNGSDKEAAAIEAGYSEHTARQQSYELLKNPSVMQAIIERTAMELISDAPKAQKRLSELVNARSDYVALEAVREILDRAGLKPVDKHEHKFSGDIAVNIDLS